MFRVSEPFTLLCTTYARDCIAPGPVEKFSSILFKVVKGALSGKSTPQTNPKKKRPLSSPADPSDLKKTKPVIEADGSSLPIAEEPESSPADQSDPEAEAGSAPTQITLSEEI